MSATQNLLYLVFSVLVLAYGDITVFFHEERKEGCDLNDLYEQKNMAKRMVW